MTRGDSAYPALRSLRSLVRGYPLAFARSGRTLATRRRQHGICVCHMFHDDNAVRFTDMSHGLDSRTGSWTPDIRSEIADTRRNCGDRKPTEIVDTQFPRFRMR